MPRLRQEEGGLIDNDKGIMSVDIFDPDKVTSGKYVLHLTLP